MDNAVFRIAFNVGQFYHTLYFWLFSSYHLVRLCLHLSPSPSCPLFYSFHHWSLVLLLLLLRKVSAELETRNFFIPSFILLILHSERLLLNWKQGISPPWFCLRSSCPHSIHSVLDPWSCFSCHLEKLLLNWEQGLSSLFLVVPVLPGALMEPLRSGLLRCR